MTRHVNVYLTRQSANAIVPAMKKKKDALKKAVAAAGGQAALGRMIGCSRQAIAQWDEVPLERVIDVEKATGIPRAELRPDYFGNMA